MKNINDEYFNGIYQDIWRTQIPDKLTSDELEFLIGYFGLKDQSKVLDLMCGYGRHSLGLARKDIFVMSIDNLKNYIDEIDRIVEQEKLTLVTQLVNVMDFKTDLLYDLVISMGNNMSFFDYDESLNIIKKVSQSLKPGGYFLINSWMIAEIAYRFYESESKSVINGIQFSSKSNFLWSPNRIETTTTAFRNEELIEKKYAVDYIYSLSETEAMLSQNGLQLKKVYSIPGKKEFKIGDPRSYVIAQKTTL